MTYMNMDAKCGAPRDIGRRGAQVGSLPCGGAMPAHVFLRLFLSALAAILAIHFWKHGGR